MTSAMELQENKERESGDSGQNEKSKDVIIKIIGSFGRYHLWICFLMYINKFHVAFNQMAIIFLSPRVSYICPDTNQTTCPCENPIYDRTLFTNSIIMEWDLICENSWLRDFTQTLFQLGTLIGSILFGMASDRFGRKWPLIAAVILQLGAGIAAAYMPNYWAFTFMRFLIGASIGGVMVVGFVLMMEYIGPQYREVVSALYQAPFNLGHMLLPAFGYYFRDFSDFQLAISIPTVLLLSYIIFVPESPRWLLAVNQTEKATKLMERVAKINKRPTEKIKEDIELYQADKVVIKKGTVVDLFRTPNIRRNIIAMSLNWMVCSYCFYGVSQYVGQLSGNVFVNVAASASVAFVGTLVSVPLLKCIGRKTMVITFNLICSVCLLAIAVAPEGPITVVLACVGVVASFIVFVVVYLYASELFPTVVRNAALGVSSMMARVGSMVAPFVVGLNDIGRWMPPVAFGVLPLFAAALCLLLPETRGCEMMTTIEEAENFGKKKGKEAVKGS